MASYRDNRGGSPLKHFVRNTGPTKTCRARRTLCRGRLIGPNDLEPPSRMERRLPRRLGADTTTVRQACQICLTTDISGLLLAPAAELETLMRRRHAAAIPRERFLVFV